MKTNRIVTFLIVTLLVVFSSAIAQDNQLDRRPAVAGQFYPADKNELSKMLKNLFARAVAPEKMPGVVAIICPHAGYVYSGGVAASSYNQIDPTKEYDNIFVLGPSHYVGFEGASVYDEGDFITPLGTVKVNRELGQELIKKHKVFTDRADAHRLEHSIEVQLPFIQYIMRKPFRIVPIVVGASTLDACAEIASALRPYFNSKNLFVISTDFSHYPAYDDANAVDKATADAVLSNSAENLIRTIGTNEKKGIPNLVTCMCGWPCVLTLLSITHNIPNITFTPIEYRNSGDSDIGDKSRVVGYYSIVVSIKEAPQKAGFNLNDNEKKTLLAIARNTLEQQFQKDHILNVDPSTLTENLKTNCGAFVTLNEHHELRGCVGRFEPDEPLFKVVQTMALAAATQDYRFSPVRQDELKSIELEISVLTPLKRIDSIDEIQLGKHGIYIKKGSYAGTFLPQVATETGWNKEEFLGHCAQDKAGIGWDGWKDAEIYTYEALVFGENGTGK
jgi:MEMO1 family protein